MSRDPLAPPGRAGGTSFRAWAYLIAGSVLVVAGAVLPPGATDAFLPAKAVLLFAGLVTLGAAVARRLRTASQDVEARITTAALLVTAGLGVIVAYAGTPNGVVVEGMSPQELQRPLLPPIQPERQWDSARMVLGVLAFVAMAGAVLVVLPSVARKAVVSLLILLHFANIAVSVTSVPPPNGPAPWLSVQAWAHFFRPYASFMYLNNAYHFYSPEPGPPTLAWFYVRYSDESGRWIKLPSRKDSPVPIHFQRLLALTESINVINHNTPPDFGERAEKRRVAGKLYEPEIPLPLDFAPQALYQPPEEYSALMVGTYARYVARHWPHPDDNPEAEVKTVKVYRLVHSIINAPQLAEKMSPNDPSLDLPYFMGEFNREGDMLDPTDPFLYFLVPIYRQDGNVVNYLELHATGKPSAAKEPQP